MSKKEKTIDLLSKGYKLKEIAVEIGISQSTLFNVLEKLREEHHAKTNEQLIYNYFFDPI